MIFVRWKRGESRRGRVFPGPVDGDPLFNDRCVQCGDYLGGNGDIQLIAVGPVSEDERGRHDEGRWYNAGAVALHRVDVDGLSDAELDALCAELVVSDSRSSD